MKSFSPSFPWLEFLCNHERVEEFKFGCELILFGYDVLSCKRRLSFRCMCLSKTVWTTPVVVDLPCIPQALSSDNKELISAFQLFNMMEMGETTSSLSCHLLNCREININLFISLDVWCAGCGDRNWILSHDMKVSKRRGSCCDEECVFVVDLSDTRRILLWQLFGCCVLHSHQNVTRLINKPLTNQSSLIEMFHEPNSFCVGCQVANCRLKLRHTIHRLSSIIRWLCKLNRATS